MELGEGGNKFISLSLRRFLECFEVLIGVVTLLKMMG